MDIRALGPLEVERDGELLNLGGAKQRSVLAVLVLHAGKVLDTDRLADAVWDGNPPASAESTLRSYVSNLRKVLEPDRGPKDPPKILKTTRAGYVLDVPDAAIDLRRFEKLVRGGREARNTDDVRRATDLFTEAIGLWHGDTLQDFAYAEFARSEAARLEELRLACLEDLFDARIALGEHDQVVGDVEAFCNHHPLRERALASKMLALYRCGRQAEALEAYENGRRRLADELGVDPSPELRDVHARIIRQDEALTATQQPSGKRTLTFLLGDVERSTEKLRALGADYARVLEDNRLTLREACQSHGGYAIRTYGDATFAAFDCATDAIGAAVSAQLAGGRAGHDTLPVRMGLHTGEATFSGGEYVGLAVHVASRVMDAAHGGQVLVSGAAKELFEAEEGGEVDLADAGAHELKDIPDAMRLFQVVHPNLRRDFPPLRTRSARNDNLPQRPTSFLGRNDDLQQIEATLAEARILTLTGVGGVGKTRLALEAGSRLASRYPDGVWFCELAPVLDPGGLVHSMASTLRVEQQRGLSMRDSLLAALRQRDTLVILDNCEHLLEPVAELLEDVVHRCPTTDVLATSREMIGVDGERARPVRSLPVSGEATAVRLFEDRARAVRPDFAIDEHNAADIEDICDRLDGIPLAIELAAARVTSMSPAQIAKRMEADFRFLRSGRRAAVDRHRTLQGAIDWSYTMLSEAEKLLFDRLSVFAGGFTLESAEDVCGGGLGLDVADGLASLVAKSMIDANVTGEEARYSLLETMRQYAQDRLLERGEAHDLLRAHASHVVQMFEAAVDLYRVDSERAGRRLVAELDNLRAAHAWAQSAGDVHLVMRITGNEVVLFWLTFREVLGWAERAIQMPGSETHPLLPIVLIAVSAAAQQRGDFARQRELLERALECPDDPDDPRRAWPLALLWYLSLSEGELEEARRWNAEHLRVARVNDHSTEESWALSAGSMTESNAGNHATAIEMAEAAYELARTFSSAWEANALYYLGEALLAAGRDLERARECLERSISLAQASEFRFGVGISLVALASLRARHGDPVEALPMFTDLIDRWRRAGDWTRQWVTLRNLVELFARVGADAAAATLDSTAESSSTAFPSSGAQGERLAALRVELAVRMDEEAYAAASARGRMMSDEEAVAYAKTEIARALESIRAEA